MNVQNTTFLRLAILSLIVSSCSNTPKQAADTKTAKTIPGFDTSSIDKRYRPQDDFDSFANGNWKKMNPVPSTESNWGSFHILDKENSEVKLKGIIDENLIKENHENGSNEQKITDMYKSFMDTSAIEKLGVAPLKPYMDKISAITDLSQWLVVSGELQKIGIPSVFGIYVDADDRNSRMNAVKWAQGGLSLGEKSYYSAGDERMKMIRNEFVKHVNNMMEMSGITSSQNIGETILKFETSVAALQLSNVELRDPIKTYNKIAGAELKKLARQADWLSFSAAQGVVSDSIVVQNKKYFTTVSALLAKTPIENLKLYLNYQVVHNYSRYLPSSVKNENFNFYGTIKSGVKEQKKRDIQAIEVAEMLGEGNIIGQLYTKKFFPESSKKKVAEMIDNVRAVYGERIEKLSWMSDSTKAMAKTKLKTFTYKIGYPDKWEDYTAIVVKPGALIENVISNTLWSHNKMLSDVGKPVDKKRWYMPPQTVNAYYNPLNNEIVFPAGILQAPFFNPDADDAINYGGIIAVIGHEFTHGFDDQGAQYDETGNLRNWWGKSDFDNFNALGARYISYFNTFSPLTGVNINGELTIGENIADLGGLTLAYYALKKSLEGKAEPAKIDGFTWQQRFFLSWAQVWHNNIKDEELRNRLQTDPHSPARYRINGPLKHLPEFYEAWGIIEGDKMWIPADQRVSIW